MLLSWAPQQAPATTAGTAMRLLARVFAENYEVDETGACRQTRAQPTGAVHNPHEPEAQWSSKSTTKDKSWIGYKTQVAETVQDEPRQSQEPTRSFVTAVATQNASASDKAGLAQTQAEQAQQGLQRPSVLYVDGAYVSSAALQEAQAEGCELRGPAPASPARGPGFTVERFDVQVQRRFAVCPAGQASTNCSRLQEKETGKVAYRIEWNRATCGACSLAGQCLGRGQTQRTILVGQWHHLLQERRREMSTEAFQADMHHRNGIEGTQSELVRAYGLRRARYRGLAKVRLQNYLIGAACNVCRLYRRIAWEIRQGLRPCGSISAITV